MVLANDRDSRVAWMHDALTTYEVRLLRYTVRLVNGDADLARDVVQESFLKLWQQDRAKVASHVGPWLFRVCRNAALDRLRKDQRMHTVLPDSPTLEKTGQDTNVADGSNVEREETESRLLACVADLPSNQREVVRLKFQGELSYREIAEVLDLTVSNVGVLLHKAIGTLRQQMVAAESPAVAPARGA